MNDQLTNIEMGQLIKSLLDEGRSCRFKVKGSSMRPFIREGDMVTVVPAHGQMVSAGDVVAYINPDSDRFLLHRVIAHSCGGLIVTIKGDNCEVPDAQGYLPEDGIMGKVVKLERFGRRVRLGLGIERGFIAQLSSGGRMAGKSVLRRLRLGLVSSMAVLMLLGLMSAAVGKDKTKTKEKPKRKPLVVMKQAKIQGKTFFLSEEGKDAVADNLLIEVRTIEDNLVIYKTATDKTGSYTLPNLDVGKYHLVMGRLIVMLQVEDVKIKSREQAAVAKTIIMFIPQAMGKWAKIKR